MPDYERTFRNGVELVSPYLALGRNFPLRTEEDEKALRRGIETLLSIPRQSGDWRLCWYVGKSFEALGSYDRSYEYFKVALNEAPPHKDVIHEYVVAALRVHNVRDALDAGLSGLEVFPDDPRLMFDAALCYFASGDRDSTLSVLDRLDKIAPFDDRVAELRSRVTEKR